MPKEIVVLLHGMGNSKWNMLGVEMALKKAGYDTYSITYPSLCFSIKKIATFVYHKLKIHEIWSQYERVHFVTHSMGGLVTREYLEGFKRKIPQQKLGRVVMIAPPLGGSEIADRFKGFLPYKMVFGSAGQELSTQVQGKRNIKPYYDLGVIAGTVSWPLSIGDLYLLGQHDGRVRVEKTKVEGMKDHIALPFSHDFICWMPSVHRLVLRFLGGGAF